MGGWFRKEIKTVGDLNGLKMRIAGIAGQVFAKLGVVPQQIAGGDIYPSLEKGTIDAAEWIGPYDDEKLGFQRVAPFYYYPGWWEGGLNLSFYVAKPKYDELPAVYREVLESACRDATLETLAKYDAQNPQALRRLVAGGTQLRAFPREVLQACYKAAFELYDETSARNPTFKGVWEHFRAFRDTQYQWFRVAENTFDNFVYFMHAQEQRAATTRAAAALTMMAPPARLQPRRGRDERRVRQRRRLDGAAGLRRLAPATPSSATAYPTRPTPGWRCSGTSSPASSCSAPPTPCSATSMCGWTWSTANLGERARIWVDVFGIILFLLPATVLLAWMTWPFFVDSFVRTEGSPNAGGLLRWPVKILMPLGFLLLTLQGLSELVKRIALLRGDQGRRREVVVEYHRPEQ